ncbi:MAG: hypothetical protein QXY49_05980 [Thermofilaceae archaeon]
MQQLCFTNLRRHQGRFSLVALFFKTFLECFPVLTSIFRLPVVTFILYPVAPEVYLAELSESMLQHNPFNQCYPMQWGRERLVKACAAEGSWKTIFFLRLGTKLREKGFNETVSNHVGLH